MEEAKQLLLLLGDEERIYQVAEQVGCSNARYFGQAFKNIPDRRRQRIFGSIRIKQEETKMDSMRSLQTKMEWSLIWMNVIIMLVVHLKKK